MAFLTAILASVWLSATAAHAQNGCSSVYWSCGEVYDVANPSVSPSEPDGFLENVTSPEACLEECVSRNSDGVVACNAVSVPYDDPEIGYSGCHLWLLDDNALPTANDNYQSIEFEPACIPDAEAAAAVCNDCEGSCGGLAPGPGPAMGSEPLIPTAAPEQAPSPSPPLPSPSPSPKPAAVPSPSPSPTPPSPPPPVEQKPVTTPTASSLTWETMPEMPIELGEVAAGVLPLNGKDYLVVVGESDAGQNPDENGLTVIYDFATGDWTTGAKRPYIGNHHAAEVYDGKWYVIGGFGAEPRVQIGELFIAGDGSVDISWTVADSQPPILVASAGSWLVGSSIYYCGGIKGTFTINTCAIYDIPSDSWTTQVDDLVYGRNHAANCAQPGGPLFFIGGRSFGNELQPGYDDTQIFENGMWSLGTPLPLARGGMGAGVYDSGKCYVFGGEFGDEISQEPEPRSNDARASYAVDIYDIASDSWSRGPDIPSGMHGTYAVKYGNAIHIAGGGTKAKFSQSKLHYRLVL